MRLLLVEDEPAFRDRVLADLAGLPGCTVTVAASRESALAEIRSSTFDLALCDLKIPPRDGGLDAAEEHGFMVYEELRSEVPGTPAIFLTGYATADNIAERLSDAPLQDCFGTGEPVSMARLRTKEKLVDCIRDVLAHASEVAQLDCIEVNVSGGLELETDAIRALRIAARRVDGLSVDVTPLGGLSGATTLRMQVLGFGGTRRATMFGKVASLEAIKAELRIYELYVPAMLPIGSFPPHVQEVVAGVGRHAAVFYSLADAEAKELFSICIHDQVRAVRSIRLVDQHMQGWQELSGDVLEISVGELRRRRLSDELLGMYLEQIPEAAAYEEERITMPTFLQHGDLHGGNVLVGDSSAVLIDFGDVGFGPSGYDPITFELSLVFHPDSKAAAGEWPSLQQCRDWFDLDAFVAGCPVESLVRESRAWCNRVQPDRNLLAAVVYAHALRQLKYPQTDKLRALAIARGAIEATRR